MMSGSNRRRGSQEQHKHCTRAKTSEGSTVHKTILDSNLEHTVFSNCCVIQRMCVVHLSWHLSIVQIEIVHDLPAYVCSFALNTFRRISWETKKKTRGKERTGNDDASRGRGRHLWQDAILFCLPIYAPKLDRSCCAGALTCHSGYNLLCDPMRLCNFIYYIWCLEIFAYSTYTGRLILIGRAKVEAKSESLRMTYGWSIFQEDILLDQIPCH